jgi:hypothetical protein
MATKIGLAGPGNARHGRHDPSSDGGDRAPAERYLTDMQAALHTLGGDFAGALAGALSRLWVERDEVPAMGDPAKAPATLADVNSATRRPIERAATLQDVHDWLSALVEPAVVVLAPVRSFRNYIPGARLGPCFAFRDRAGTVTVTLVEAGEAIRLSPGDRRLTQPVHFEVLSGEPGSLRYVPPGTGDRDAERRNAPTAREPGRVPSH